MGDTQVLSVDREVEKIEAEIRDSKTHNSAVNKQVEQSKLECSKHKEQYESLIKEEESIKKAMTATLPALK